MKAQKAAGALHRLRDSDLQLADPRADIRDRTVVDSAGEEIGKIDDLLIDERERRVRFLDVGSGGFLGLGETKFLLPVDVVTDVHEDRVQVSPSRERVAGAPGYNPKLIERQYLDDLYRYYGYRTPFWGAGYRYPRHPHRG